MKNNAKLTDISALKLGAEREWSSVVWELGDQLDMDS
jgi:hypothetical protein